MADYQDTYSRMTNDQLLNLAQEADQLTPPARLALDTELKKRKLGPAEIAEQVEYLRSLEMEAARRKLLAQTFNGFGTKIYGKRDFELDGSFLTTKWVVFFWVPLVPLKSFRVRYKGSGGASVLPGWSRQYLVLAEYRPHRPQLIAIYSFLFSFVACGWILDSLHAGPLTALSAFAAWASIPWLLRCRAKRVARQPANARGQRVS